MNIGSLFPDFTSCKLSVYIEGLKGDNCLAIQAPTQSRTTRGHGELFFVLSPKLLMSLDFLFSFVYCDYIPSITSHIQIQFKYLASRKIFVVWFSMYSCVSYCRYGFERHNKQICFATSEEAGHGGPSRFWFVHPLFFLKFSKRNIWIFARMVKIHIYLGLQHYTSAEYFILWHVDIIEIYLAFAYSSISTKSNN